MSFIPILDAVTGIVDKLIPDPEKRYEFQIELAKLADAQDQRDSNQMIAQTEVNKVEAASSSLFVAGWRPAVGWACVAGFVYNIIFAPMFKLGLADPALLSQVLLGMLGISVAARSIEKIKGVAQNTLTGEPAKVTPIALPIKPKKKVLGIKWPF